MHTCERTVVAVAERGSRAARNAAEDQQEGGCVGVTLVVQQTGPFRARCVGKYAIMTDWLSRVNGKPSWQIN